MSKKKYKSNKPRYLTVRIKYYPLSKKYIFLPVFLFFFYLFFSVGNYISSNWVTAYATYDIKPLDKYLITIPDGENFVLPQIEINDQVIFHGSRDQKKVALTFDADMTPGMEEQLQSGKVESYYNQNVIEVLNQSQTKATLFLTGMWIETYPDAAKELAQNPLFELASHSYSHPGFDGECYGLTPLSDNHDQEELQKTQKLLKDLSGVDNRLFRFPGGCYSQYDVDQVHKNGMDVIQWDAAGQDGFNDNPVAIEENVLRNVQNGSIIVLHMHGGPYAPKTADALPQIIQTLKERGFSFVTVSELLHVDFYSSSEQSESIRFSIGSRLLSNNNK